MQAGVVNAPIERSVASKQTPGVTPVHDLNVPYEGTEEYETPTADLLFPPVSFSCFLMKIAAWIVYMELCTVLHHMVDVLGSLQCQTPLQTPIPQTPMQTPIPQTPIQTPLPGTGDNLYNIPTGPSEDSGGGNSGGNTDMKPGRPSPYMVNTSFCVYKLYAWMK